MVSCVLWRVKIRIMKKDIKSKTIDEIKGLLGIEAFRARQIFAWIHKKRASSFEEMTNLPKNLRQKLVENYYIGNLVVLKKIESKDRTIKYLLELEDGNKIECVHIKSANGKMTVCVSSQVGCPLKCSFCATGTLPFKRDLAVSEILSQIYLSSSVSNVVYMGMGEPFLNFDNVIKSIEILNAKEGIALGARRITVSTSGIPDGIISLAKCGLQVRLAVSLNSAKDEVRSKIMPINMKYPLKELHDAIKIYQRLSNRRVTLEYVMLRGINDSGRDLNALINFCRGLDVNVNVIKYNCFEGMLKPSPIHAISNFINSLKDAGIEAVQRNSRGSDINAACGQLALNN